MSRRLPGDSGEGVPGGLPVAGEWSGVVERRNYWSEIERVAGCVGRATVVLCCFDYVSQPVGVDSGDVHVFGGSLLAYGETSLEMMPPQKTFLELLVTALDAPILLCSR